MENGYRDKKIFTENRRAHFDYEIIEQLEAGLSLLGGEVKSIQNGRVNLAGARIFFRGEVPYLASADIPAYQPKNAGPSYDPLRERPILLGRKEISYLLSKTHEKKLTIIPLSVYNKGRRIKLEIGLGRRRKKSDQREAIKKREIRREMKREAR